MNKSGVYKITNPKGKVYIGRSKNIKVRFKRYSQYKTTNLQPKLFESFDRYGFDNHIFEILDHRDNIELEAQYIKEYNSYEDGLNSNKGGGGVLNHNKITRNLISIAGKNNKGKRVNSHWKGKARSEENKLNLSLAKKGIPNPKNSKVILQYDLKNNFIKEWSSIKDANLFLGKGKDSSAIGECCKGKKQTAYKFKWKYKN
jgi:group I intron endonuclease